MIQQLFKNNELIHFMHSLFEHKADIGIRGIGKNAEEAFSEAAKAMLKLLIGLAFTRATPVILLHYPLPGFSTQENSPRFLQAALTEEQPIQKGFFLTVQASRQSMIITTAGLTAKKVRSIRPWFAAWATSQE